MLWHVERQGFLDYADLSQRLYRLQKAVELSNVDKNIAESTHITYVDFLFAASGLCVGVGIYRLRIAA